MPKKKTDEVSRRYKTIAEKMIGISNEYDSITKGEMSFPFYDGDFDLSLFKESRTLIKEVAEFYSVEETTAVLLSLLTVKQRKLVYVDDLFEKLKLPYLCYSILENHFNELNDRCFIFLLQMKKDVDKEAIVMTDAFLDSLKHNAHFNPVPKVCADEDEFNRLVKEDLYYVLLNENYRIICIRRVDHIKALEHVEVSEVYHRGAFNDRPFDEIHYGHIMALSDLLRPFHHFLSRRLTAEYGKKLFDDMTGQILFKINPYRQQWQPLINYDLEWLHDNFHTTYQMLKQGDEEWSLMENCPIKIPNKDVEDVYKKIWLFEEELPRKEKKHCGICRHYGALVNHGYWWCNKGHTEHMDAENCEDYDDMMANVTFTATSSTTLTYNSDKTEKM